MDSNATPATQPAGTIEELSISEKASSFSTTTETKEAPPSSTAASGAKGSSDHEGESLEFVHGAVPQIGGEDAPIANGPFGGGM
jgi:hypothetical protein